MSYRRPMEMGGPGGMPGPMGGGMPPPPMPGGMGGPMPPEDEYRLNPTRGNCVQQNKGGMWEDVECFPTPAQAQRHLLTLKINVPESAR